MTVTRIIAIAFLICTTSCSSPTAPSQYTGDYFGLVVPSHSQTLWIRIKQQGSDAVGSACLWDIGLVRPTIYFDAVPVQISYPSIAVDGRDGFSFIGKFVADKGAIKGNYYLSGNGNDGLTPGPMALVKSPQPGTLPGCTGTSAF